jgi:hypothetical protein
MDEPRRPSTVPALTPPESMDALLTHEITQVLATLGLDPLGLSRTVSLRAASVGALGRQADRHERFALLYRRFANRRGQAH